MFKVYTYKIKVETVVHIRQFVSVEKWFKMVK